MPRASWPLLTCLVSPSATPTADSPSSLTNSLWLRFLQHASRPLHMLFQPPATPSPSVANSSLANTRQGQELLPVLQWHSPVSWWSNLPCQRSSHWTKATPLGLFSTLFSAIWWMNEWMIRDASGRSERWEGFRESEWKTRGEPHYGIGSVLCCGLRGVGVLFLLFSIFSKTNLGPNYCHSEQLEFPKPREAAVLQDKTVSQGLCWISFRATLALLSRVSKFFKFKGWFDYDKFFPLYEIQTSTH